ncbi:MAG TPA: hypothetical protein DD979_02790, partial [Gammaproteobacteria bacterium]|nr:hypothetical protein [Gammaproteobacteria bacterium]
FAGQATTMALPDNAMVVELANASGHLIDFAEIKHGNSQSQESIITLQIRPGETRRLVMNHTPGLGFNLIVLTGGERIEVCVGKASQSRQLRQTFHDNGLIVESDVSRSWLVEHALSVF